jgi:competence protein ComEA
MRKTIISMLFAALLLPMYALAAGAVDLNSADAAALESIKGIGPARAAAIIQYRDKHGPFASVDELVKVPGIGDKSITQLRDQLSVTPARKADSRTK